MIVWSYFGVWVVFWDARLEKMMHNWIGNFVEKFGKNWNLSNIYDALRVPPAVTRLTVYRRLQVRIGRPSMPRRLQTYSEKVGSFFKIFEFFTQEQPLFRFFRSRFDVCGGACKRVCSPIACSLGKQFAEVSLSGGSKNDKKFWKFLKILELI